jgi:hypothetical protein
MIKYSYVLHEKVFKLLLLYKDMVDLLQYTPPIHHTHFKKPSPEYKCQKEFNPFSIMTQTNFWFLKLIYNKYNEND